jgi:hypothetical protein
MLRMTRESAQNFRFPARRGIEGWESRVRGVASGIALLQGYAWWGGVGPAPPPPTCVPNVHQASPSDPAGATQIHDDIKATCIVHH